MLAICLPAALLYVRIVLGVAASETPVTRAQADGLNRWANVAWGFFCVVQIIAARYVQQTFPAPASRLRQALQYVGVLLICIFLSLTGAIVLEAFGWNFFLRIAR